MCGNREREGGRRRWAGESCVKGRWEGWAVEDCSGRGRGDCCSMESVMGEGRGRYWSLLQLHWFPSPTLSREPEQCWQICLHVFIIIKNVTEPFSLEVQHSADPSPPPPPAQSLHLLPFLPDGLGGWGDPSFPLLSLVAPWGFLMVVESFTAMLELGGGQLNEGHPLSQGGSCMLHCPVRKGNDLPIQIKSLGQPVKGKSDNFFSYGWHLTPFRPFSFLLPAFWEGNLPGMGKSVLSFPRSLPEASLPTRGFPLPTAPSLRRPGRASLLPSPFPIPIGGATVAPQARPPSPGPSLPPAAPLPALHCLIVILPTSPLLFSSLN